MATLINASTMGVGGLVTTADNTGILQLQTAGSTALTIDGSQNVGIGTASPSYKLDVSSDIRIQGSNTKLYFDTLGGSASNYVGTTNTYWLSLYNGRGSTAGIDITNSAYKIGRAHV